MSELRLECPPVLDQETGRELLTSVSKQNGDGAGDVVLDFAKTERMDSRGGAWLIEIADQVRSRRGELRFEGQRGEVAEFIQMIEPGLQASKPSSDEKDGFFARIGGSVLNTANEARDFSVLFVDAVYWTLIAPFEGRGFRWGLFIDEIHEMGVRGLRISFLMNFLLGLIIAMMSAAQLRRYGVDIYVADLVMIAFARELAVIMTSVVVSARTGAAIAAELATMKVQEEIDALRGMGLNVTQFLVAPKILALQIVLPILTALGMFAGIMGGACWGTFVLGYRLDTWLAETQAAATYADVFQGMLKAVVFSVVIVLVGCHNGLRVKGGSRGVGLMTTRAVVMDIFFIVVIDMIFALIFYYVLDL
ncbi:MAG: ABC transporter permease [FCB group bacterium]|jgi:phospholipid/cholesterol/gamma-HCH transport system permease protein|nr:ABC transporter permease [FCB group bacterium]